ncbi:ATP-binding protein [uncultured Desulfosarcina sp.]|uniref:sensor histidine kinase n=1 Tax=uncultured Desulfosarcina sp. TaxID=218289 RepID=UPI0029C86321|nr:ATP-binding protein [uncultured Desulfosarcina sp.]
MLFIYTLVMFIFLERTIAHYTEQKRAFLQIACENVMRLRDVEHAIEAMQDSRALKKDERFLFLPAESLRIEKGDSGLDDSTLRTAVLSTLRSGQPITQKTGKTFGLLFSRHEAVIVTFPVEKKGRILAAGGLKSPLTVIYQDFRRVQKIAFVFVVITSCFFALIGNRQLSRVYFKPLQRLAKRAETYTDEDPLFFAVRKEDNEFSTLSASLNKMLERISRDKSVLKETIGSLKTTNLELQKAQNDVIRAEKLATVGRLTSGIAHEIGNPIGIVLGYLDLMKQTDLTRDEQNDFIRRSEKEIARIHHIIRQLLDMTRTSSDESKTITVRPLLEELVSVFSYQPSANGIVFESQFNADEDHVVADPERLRQVFLNILLNAVDAINSEPPSEPRIKLISHCSIDENGSYGKDGKKVIEIQIQDNGPGIEPSDLNHIFDPFFTTKQPGQGTGLGLSVSFMIIEKLGGTMSVSSGKEEGTLFRVRLPLAELKDRVIEPMDR